MPPVTVADRVAVHLSLAAGACGGWAFAWNGGWAPVAVAILAGVALAALQLARIRRAQRSPPAWLEHRPDGSLWLAEGAATAVPVVLGAATRLVGPSVFLDLRCAGRRPRRLWLTRPDIPAAALRRWSVVLPRTGRAACA